MKSFKDFNIKPKLSTFPGKKIEVNTILNIEILVHDYKIEPSKKKIGTDLLTLDFELENERRIIFSGSVILIDMIKQVPKENFPFKTTIKLKGQHLEFT